MITNFGYKGEETVQGVHLVTSVFQEQRTRNRVQLETVAFSGFEAQYQQRVTKTRPKLTPANMTPMKPWGTRPKAK